MKSGVALLLAVAALAWGGEAWRGKDFHEWAQDDVDRVLNDSAWAKETLASFQMPRHPAAAKESDSPVDITYAPNDPNNGGMPAGPGRSPVTGAGPMTADPSAGAGMPAIRVIVRWESALPVKEALLRLKFGAQMPGPGDPAYTLDRSESYYVVAVVGLQMPKGKKGGKKAADGEQTGEERMRDEFLATTKLTRRGKPALMPEEVKVNPPEARTEVLFLFPKSDPIVAGDKEVTFNAALGPLEMKKNFKLKEMVYRGKLEL